MKWLGHNASMKELLRAVQKNYCLSSLKIYSINTSSELHIWTVCCLEIFIYKYFDLHMYLYLLRMKLPLTDILSSYIFKDTIRHWKQRKKKASLHKGLDPKEQGEVTRIR